MLMGIAEDIVLIVEENKLLDIDMKSYAGISF